MNRPEQSEPCGSTRQEPEEMANCGGRGRGQGDGGGQVKEISGAEVKKTRGTEAGGIEGHRKEHRLTQRAGTRYRGPKRVDILI